MKVSACCKILIKTWKARRTRSLPAPPTSSRRNKVQGLIVTGGFVTLFNPGLEAKVAEAVRIPVTSAVSSVTVALRALSATRVMLVTPFTADMNAHIEKHLTNLGFTVFPGPPYDKNRKPGAGVEISPDELFRRVEASYRQNPKTQAIYFQGATLDPLPIIQRLEDNLGVPVDLQQHRNVLEHPVKARSRSFRSKATANYCCLGRIPQRLAD